MKHLEEYEEYQFSPFGIFSTVGSNSGKKVKKINYNFYCIEKLPDLIESDIIPDYLNVVQSMFDDIYNVSIKYGKKWKAGELKSEVEKRYHPKPILFVEGEHDITYIKAAAEQLGKTEILNKIELRQRGGYSNLDKLWTVLNQESWETIPQIKILLYDCDTKKLDEDSYPNFKRIIPSKEDSTIITGIENLFPIDLVEKAIKEKSEFIDFKKTEGTVRGKPYRYEYNVVNKDEKKNFCNWVCANAGKEDFQEFNIVFEIIEDIIN